MSEEKKKPQDASDREEGRPGAIEIDVHDESTPAKAAGKTGKAGKKAAGAKKQTKQS